MNRATVKNAVKDNRYLQEKLFYKGFLITDDKDINHSEYPFSDNWSKYRINGSYELFVHNRLPVYLKSLGEELTLGLLGHAYDPFKEIADENEILSLLAKSFEAKEDFFEGINRLTGMFCLFWTQGNKIEFLNDAVGLESVFYSRTDDNIYISAHVNLIGDIKGYQEDPEVTKLKAAKTFHLFGNQLPGIITVFKEVKRLNPNHIGINDVSGIMQRRFYWPKEQDKGVDEVCKQLVPVMQKTMELIAKKWKRPAISLTGGCDSKTTLACAKGIYDRYRYFSYDSQKNELPDAIAAKSICDSLGLPHTLYSISYDDSEFEGIEGVRAVLEWNGGNVRYNNPNDVRKRIFLDKIDDFDIEVKSWASEVGRARYTKRYSGRRNFGRPTPRKCTTFYKFLFFSRKNVHRCDKWFKEYLCEYFEQSKESPLPWQDQFYWEWHWPSRDGINLTSEQEFSNDITVPYNNRKILELFLSVKEEDRIKDTLYTRVRDMLDPRIDKAAEAVVDVNHTSKRAKLESIYYTLNNLLPF